jgi:multiple sugar transport system permease protein
VALGKKAEEAESQEIHHRALGSGKATRWNIQRISLKQTAVVSLIVVLAAVMMLPFFWMITTALKTNNAVYQLPPQFIPTSFDLSNFSNGMRAVHFVRLFINTAIIAALSTVGSVLSSMWVGYGLSRIRFPGRRIWFYIFVGSMMLPGIVGLLPLFRLYDSIGWYNTWLPLIVPAWFGNPFFIFLARQFYLTIPRSYDEAAKLDGAGHFTILWRIMVPLTRPVWITMAIFAFQGAWNDYLQPLVYLYSQSKWTLSLGMASFSGIYNTPWNEFMATDLIYMLPPLIIFFVAQRYFMEGLGSLGGGSLR